MGAPHVESRIGASGTRRASGRIALAVAAIAGLVGLAACTPGAPDDDRVTSPDGAADDAATSAGWSDAAWGMQAIGAPVLWDYADRVGVAPVDVGVFDSFRAGHLHGDLGDVDASLIPAETTDVEAQWHGLHVAGTIAADGGGLRGVAPNATLHLAGYGASSDDPDELDRGIDPDHVSGNALIAGIRGLADGGSGIVNVSQGLDAETAVGAAEGDADARAEAERLGGAIGEELTAIVADHPELLIVAAAGNASCTAPEHDDGWCEEEAEADAEWGLFAQAREQHPQLRDHILIVGASARIDGAAGLEEWAQSERGADILAPGRRVLSTVDADGCEDGAYRTGSLTGTPCDERGYAAASGTSMSAPHVTGVAAVLRGVTPALTPGQVQPTPLAPATAPPTPRVARGAGAGVDDRVPSLDAPSALGLAVRTVGMPASQIDDLVAHPVDDGVPPALQGTWCAGGDESADCVEIGSYRDGNEPEEPLALTAEDPIGRDSLASTLRACLAESCDDEDEVVALRYSPPGAVAECAPGGARDDCSDAEAERASASPVGWPRLEEIGEDGASSEPYLPVIAPAEDSGVDLTGRWCATDDSATDGCVVIDQGAGTATSDGEDAQEVRAAASDGGWTPLADGISADACTELAVGDFDDAGIGAIAPFGTFCPAGHTLDAQSLAGISDRPDEDRIGNSQTGTLLLRSSDG